MNVEVHAYYEDHEDFWSQNSATIITQKLFL